MLSLVNKKIYFYIFMFLKHKLQPTPKRAAEIKIKRPENRISYFSKLVQKSPRYKKSLKG